jgi:hypothetical protein
MIRLQEQQQSVGNIKPKTGTFNSIPKGRTPENKGIFPHPHCFSNGKAKNIAKISISLYHLNSNQQKLSR